MAIYRRSAELLRELAAALGLPPGAQKVVLVVDLFDVPRVYVKGLLKDEDRASKVVGAVRASCVADVTVSDDCDVAVTTHEQDALAKEQLELMRRQMEVLEQMSRNLRGPML